MSEHKIMPPLWRWLDHGLPVAPESAPEVCGPGWVAVDVKIEFWDRVLDSRYSTPAGVVPEGERFAADLPGRFFIRREHLSKIDPEWLSGVREAEGREWPRPAADSRRSRSWIAEWHRLCDESGVRHG